MLGDKIYSLRKNKKISQEEFAAVLNTSRQAVSKWERNESKPDIDKLILIAKLFNVSVDFLLSYEIEYSDVDTLIKELEHCIFNNILNVSVDDIRLWCSKYMNNFKLCIIASKYLLVAYYNNKNPENLELALSCLNKAVELYRLEDNDGVSLHDLHKAICDIYETQQKYDIAKEYIEKHNMYDCKLLLAKCELNLLNYDTALELSSNIFLESSSNIINVSIIQLLVLLNKDQVEEAYDLTKWTIEFVNSIKNSDDFFEGLLSLLVYARAVCERALNINNDESVNILKRVNLNQLKETTISHANVVKHYFGKMDEFMVIDINVKETIMETINKLSESDKYYNIFVSLYNEIFGGE